MGASVAMQQQRCLCHNPWHRIFFLHKAALAVLASSHHAFLWIPHEDRGPGLVLLQGGAAAEPVGPCRRVVRDDGGGQPWPWPCWVSCAVEQLDGRPVGASASVWGSFWMCGPCRAGIKTSFGTDWVRKQKADFRGDRSLQGYITKYDLESPQRLKLFLRFTTFAEHDMLLHHPYPNFSSI